MYGEYCQNFQHVIFNILCKHSEAHRLHFGGQRSPRSPETRFCALSNKSYTDYNNAQYKFMAE